MKNTKLTVGLIACLLSVGGLAGCSEVRSSSDGVLLTYKVGDETHKISADDILENAYDDSSKYQSIFDIIYSVLVKNYFKREATVKYYGSDKVIGSKEMGDPKDVATGTEGTIYGLANQKVEDDKDTAQSNADANNTKYKKELDAILESKGVDSLDELRDKYVAEIQKERFEKNFYTYYIEDLKQGAGTTLLAGQTEAQALESATASAKLLDESYTASDLWSGYFKDQLPYHVSHILVKLEDGSGTNYANGTISEANAKRLFNVVDALGNGEDTFSTIAKQYSEDTGSRVLSGDLGIMDTSTSFVNEFKLGVYAYENIYGSASVAGSKIDASREGLIGKYEDAVEGSFGKDLFDLNKIPEIPSTVFEELKNVAETDKDEKQKPVLEGETSLFPRNIIYNKYLNRHSFAFITGAADNTTAPEYAKKTTGYHAYTAEENPKLVGKGNILSVKIAQEWTPILCVRAGSDYQGIHFIVVNRSPFVETDANGLNQTTYYTTFYPDQDEYKAITGGKGPTYINFSSKDSDVSATKKRAEELASKLKSFDSDRLSKYIFLKYLVEEKVEIQQSGLREKLLKWIKTSVEKAREERTETWNKTWLEYIDSLKRQSSERSKLVPEACRLVYTQANSTVATLTLEKAIMEALDLDSSIPADVAEYHGTDIYKEIVELFGVDKYNEFKDKELSKSFKTEGGLCNNGKAHL